MLRASYRIDSIDLLRGLVMIIMALDHTRDLIHVGANTANPLDLSTTTPLLFFTRWITHFCAPVFVFLSGTSAFLQSLRKPKKELSLFLIKRGLWLIVVELAIVTLGITFDIHYTIFFLQVIWVIGISMILLGLFIWLPLPVLFLTGLIIVCGHNLLDGYEKGRTDFSLLYRLLHKQSFVPFANGHVLAILYPFLPWTGVMLLGYCFGSLYRDPDAARRNRTIFAIGAGLLFFFVLLRWSNVYGDPTPWTPQRNGLYTLLSFVNVQKYPPSLLFLCMTIGTALIFLSLAGSTRSRAGKVITVYGRVPFLYYILHFYILHIISAILFLSRGHSFAEGARGIPNFPFKFMVPGEGCSLGVTYLIWLAVVAALYPVCKAFSEYRKTHRQWWLSYL